MSKVKAVALFSGGLDSLLAVRLIMEQGIEVKAVQFITPFFGYRYKGREREAAADFRQQYGFECIIRDVTPGYLEILKNPRYGYGKNFNPCIDCKIFMMRLAREVMEEEGADFIISGEVLGQRPMSQRRDALRIVERDSELDGILLRPLCAKTLKPTRAEEEGLVDRERLMEITGRSRKQQIALAASFGIEDYQTPAGGCLLTDPIISQRVRALLEVNPAPVFEDIMMLSMGRQFRLGSGTLYVGRNRDENVKIQDLAVEGDTSVKLKERPGPLGLIKGGPSEDDIRLAARIVARYADAKDLDTVKVGVEVKGGDIRIIDVAPGDIEFADNHRLLYEEPVNLINKEAL